MGIGMKMEMEMGTDRSVKGWEWSGFLSGRGLWPEVISRANADMQYPRRVDLRTRCGLYPILLLGDMALPRMIQTIGR